MSTQDFVAGAQAIAGIFTSLGSLGITGAGATGIVQQVKDAMNPSKAAELAACNSMMNFAALAPARVADIAKELEVMAGLPVAAQGECEVLIRMAADPTKSAVDLDQVILSIQNVINAQ